MCRSGALSEAGDMAPDLAIWAGWFGGRSQAAIRTRWLGGRATQPSEPDVDGPLVDVKHLGSCVEHTVLQQG